MNNSFKDIIPEIIRREGGFINIPADRGGATNMGVTLETLRQHNVDVDGDGDIDVDDVKALPLKTAVKLYLDQYWKPAKVSSLPATLREFYFDMVVNHGQRNAVAILQNAAVTDGKDIKVDGIIGPNTLEAVKYLDLKTLVYERVLFFANIVLEDTSQKTFWKGWMNRCVEFLDH